MSRADGELQSSPPGIPSNDRIHQGILLANSVIYHDDYTHPVVETDARIEALIDPPFTAHGVHGALYQLGSGRVIWLELDAVADLTAAAVDFAGHRPYAQDYSQLADWGLARDGHGNSVAEWVFGWLYGD
jgi:hypothetical protein